MTAFAQFNAVAIARGPFSETQRIAGAIYQPGDVVQDSNGLFSVYSGLEVCAATDFVTLARVGKFDVLCNATSDTYVSSAPVFFDTVNKVAKMAAGSNIIYLGTAAIAKVAGSTRVSVFINDDFSVLNSTAVTFTGGTGANAIQVPISLADALDIKDASSRIYQTFNTTTCSTTVSGASPGASSVGGNANLLGGTGGSSSAAGGTANVTGGAGQAGNAAGGAATLKGGAGQGSAAGGAVTITSGAAGATGVAGVVSISVGAATNGAGSAITITGGAGATGTNAGGHVNLVGGSPVSTGTPGEVQINGTSGFFEAGWSQFVAANVPVSGSSYTFFMASRPYRVKAASVICSSTGTVPTVDIIKDTGTNAPGAGTSVLTGVMTFNTTANTLVTGTPAVLVATVTMAAGDRLSTKWAGTVGSIIGGQVTVLLEPC